MGEEEGGTRGRVGGTVEATRPLSTVKLYCFVHYLYLWECFSFMSPSFFFFAWQMHTHTHTPPRTNKLSPPFIPALQLPGRGSTAAAMKDAVTLRLTVTPCYPGHRVATFGKENTDVVNVTPLSCITSFAGLDELMNGYRRRPKRGNSRKV